jgi:hypothetical protein
MCDRLEILRIKDGMCGVELILPVWDVRREEGTGLSIRWHHRGNAIIEPIHYMVLRRQDNTLREFHRVAIDEQLGVEDLVNELLLIVPSKRGGYRDEVRLLWFVREPHVYVLIHSYLLLPIQEKAVALLDSHVLCELKLFCSIEMS